MKKTKELENEETSVSMDKILKIESLDDAKVFERVASGRKFCKRGTRVQDICEEEVENYICRTRGNLLLRWYLHRKMKKNKEKLLLESRVTSVIRALAVAYIEENDETDEEIVTKNVKNIIDGLAMHQNPESVAVLEDIGTNSKVDEIREMTAKALVQKNMPESLRVVITNKGKGINDLSTSVAMSTINELLSLEDKAEAIRILEDTVENNSEEEVRDNARSIKALMALS